MPLETVSQAAYHAVARGRVQGVGFRFFVRDWAEALGLVGYVRNLPDGRVEALIEGPEPMAEEMLRKLRKGPPSARVEHLQIQTRPATGRYEGFRILP